MVAGCDKKILKYILFALNFLIFLLAVAGVIGCSVFIAKPGILDELSKDVAKLDELTSLLSTSTIRVGLYVLLAASLLILVISFFGCCGAWKESKWLLIMYAVAMLIILAIEIAAFVVVIVRKGKVEDEMKGILKTMKKDEPNTYEDLEKNLKCCGVEDNDKCVNATTPFSTGCYNKILEVFKDNYPLVLAVSIITVVIEVFLIAFACCLSSGLGENVA